MSKKFRHIACGYSYRPFLALWVYYRYFKVLQSCLAVSGLREERESASEENMNETGKVIKGEGNEIK